MPPPSSKLGRGVHHQMKPFTSWVFKLGMGATRRFKKAQIGEFFFSLNRLKEPRPLRNTPTTSSSAALRPRSNVFSMFSWVEMRRQRSILSCQSAAWVFPLLPPEGGHLLIQHCLPSRHVELCRWLKTELKRTTWDRKDSIWTWRTGVRFGKGKRSQVLGHKGMLLAPDQPGPDSAEGINRGIVESMDAMQGSLQGSPKGVESPEDLWIDWKDYRKNTQRQI